MRKALAITAMAAMSLTMAACSKKAEEAEPVAKDSAATAAPESATATGNDQGSNDQGSNDQGSNDQGSNDQGSNDQGGSNDQ